MPRQWLKNEIYNVDETMLHGVWESFCNETKTLTELFLYIIQ